MDRLFDKLINCLQEGAFQFSIPCDVDRAIKTREGNSQLSDFRSRAPDRCPNRKKGHKPEGIEGLLDTALLLHQALPETGFASQRALQRLALYQAKSRAFGMVAFLRNVRAELGCRELEQHVVPGNLVRDIGLPPFSRMKTAS